MSAHTPGPWRVSKRYQDKVDVLHNRGAHIGGTSLTVARVTVRQSWFAEQMANAHLIAAAPDLLEALQLIAGTDPVDAALDPQRAVRVAIAAIKKATNGEPNA